MDLSEVRVEIDRVDTEIRKLFVERMKLSEQVVTVKAQTGDKIYKPDREADIIERNTHKVDASIEKEYKSFIKRIMDVSRKYQYGRMVEWTECFPFHYEKEVSDHKKIAILKDENMPKLPFSCEEEVEVATYEEMAEKLENESVTAGIARMENVGEGVNDLLCHMICDHHLYVNECVVIGEEGPQKWVLFSRHLIVLPEHNRIKIMFVKANQPGAFASILAMIADYGVNITEMHSAPYREEKGWNYRLYLELAANADTQEMKSLLYQLSEESLELQLLGSYYCEGDFA